jgi:hypothetical protein
VKPDEAAELLKLLRAAYPEAKRRIGPDTAELWLAELRRLDAERGAEAVRSLIASARRWPSIAELHEQLEIARRQAAEARRDRERQEVEQAAEELPRPPLSEIPAVQELLSRWSESYGLPAAPAGKCGECGRQAEQRFQLGRFELCRECTRRRKQASLVERGERQTGAAPTRRRDPLPTDRSAERTPSRNSHRPREQARATCRLCRKELKAYERPEGFCDDCLRARVGGPTFFEDAGADRRKEPPA